jgi:hypothetical protein
MYQLYEREVIEKKNHPSTLSPPTNKKKKKFGLVIRNTEQLYYQDLHYKLCIANATNTAIAHTMALLSYPQTDLLSQATNTVDELDITTTTKHAKSFMSYLNMLVQDQIIPTIVVSATTTAGTTNTENAVNNDSATVTSNALSVWEYWSQRWEFQGRGTLGGIRNDGFHHCDNICTNDRW